MVMTYQIWRCKPDKGCMVETAYFNEQAAYDYMQTLAEEDEFGFYYQIVEFEVKGDVDE